MRSLIKGWLVPAAPRGYRPGATLQRLARELMVDIAEPEGSCLHCQAGASLVFDVQERTEGLFLSHTVSCEFRLPLTLPIESSTVGHLQIRHRGTWRREGILCKVKGRDDATGTLAAIAGQLQNDEHLVKTLLPLDFRRCELRQEAGRWWLCIEHFGASEIVVSVPPLRRYIRLVRQQQQHLLDSLLAFGRILA